VLKLKPSTERQVQDKAKKYATTRLKQLTKEAQAVCERDLQPVYAENKAKIEQAHLAVEQQLEAIRREGETQIGNLQMELHAKQEAAKNDLEHEERLTSARKTASVRVACCPDPISTTGHQHKWSQSISSQASDSEIECGPPEGPTQEAILLADTTAMDIAEGNSSTPVANATLAPTVQPTPSGSITDIAVLIVASIQQAVQAAFQPIQNQLDDLKANQDYLHAKMDDDNMWG
jgi:hypothetical protein